MKKERTLFSISMFCLAVAPLMQRIIHQPNLADALQGFFLGAGIGLLLLRLKCRPARTI
jgi:hypothetical protein